MLVVDWLLIIRNSPTVVGLQTRRLYAIIGVACTCVRYSARVRISDHTSLHRVGKWIRGSVTL